MSFLAGLQMRKKLIKATRLIGVEPKIYYAGKNKVIFAIPHGTNPSVIHDNAYVFRQIFGRDIEIVGDLKRFDIVIPSEPIPKTIPYNFDDWVDNISELDLPIVCGIDTVGKRIYYDMADRPHLLISGETGSGKSSLLRVILTTLILLKSPKEVRLLLGDLKRSEFGLFRDLPHVDAVCTDTNTLGTYLNEIKSEMYRRGDLLDAEGATHIRELDVPLPYYVVAIDEVALLRKERRIMDIVEDISTVGRSLGVLLILSMQRPDAKVLEGRLKNNLTVRISGRQSDAINARVAGTPGAELIKQSEHGRMIIALEGDLKRLQAPWLHFKTARDLLYPLKIKRVKPLKKDEEKTEETPLFGLLEGGYDVTETR